MVTVGCGSACLRGQAQSAVNRTEQVASAAKAAAQSAEAIAQKTRETRAGR
jgi:hypothetical protein